MAKKRGCLEGFKGSLPWALRNIIEWPLNLTGELIFQMISNRWCLNILMLFNSPWLFVPYKAYLPPPLCVIQRYSQRVLYHLVK